MKNYTINEMATKANCSNGFIYDLAKEGKIRIASRKGRLIKIPSTELRKIREIREKALSYNPQKVELKDTSFGMVRKIKTSNEYVCLDIARAIGIKTVYNILNNARENEKRKLENVEGNELGLNVNSKGMWLVDSNAVKKYSEVSRSEINWDKFFEELGVSCKYEENCDLKSNFVQANNVFEGTEVEIIEVNGEILFEVYSTGKALGYVKEAKGKLYPREERIDRTIINADIKPVVHGGQLYFTETQLYDFMLEAKTDKCKKFKKWLTNIVLPSMNHYGGCVVNTDKFVNSYFANLSLEVKETLKAQIVQKNNEISTSIKKLQSELDSNNKLLADLN